MTTVISGSQSVLSDEKSPVVATASIATVLVAPVDIITAGFQPYSPDQRQNRSQRRCSQKQSPV